METPHVLHKCDVKLCVNPDHLKLGNDAQNTQDMVDHGTKPKGEAIHTAKLTKESVLDIRKQYADGKSRAQIARDYNVTYATIANVISRFRWSHV